VRLPPGVRIVAAANPRSSAADGWELSAPLANRFVHLYWTYDHDVVVRGLGGTWPRATLPRLDPARLPDAVAFARRAAPFLVLAPCALWVATSADALFAGVSAWAATAVILATARRGRRSDLLAIGGGVGFGFGPFGGTRFGGGSTRRRRRRRRGGGGGVIITGRHHNRPPITDARLFHDRSGG